MRKTVAWCSLVAAVAAIFVLVFDPSPVTAAPATAGSLVSLDSQGKPRGLCPLKHTDVKAEISGFLARVTVTQEFTNPYQEKIEAVYTFPLPQNSAVDDMTMLVGTRTVRGVIKPREEARAVYEAARAAGHVASLLDQERPNIFTQSVANIMPGERVKITISYVETLKYEDGEYEFVFPMVVGPRYIPGQPTGRQGGGWAPDTDRVPDASRITPPVTPPGTRAGHDISLEVQLDAGVPLDGLACPTHEVDIVRPGIHTAVVRLKDEATIPNKDFILRYDVAGRRIADAVLTHRAQRGGFFTLILQPPDRIAPADLTPKELVFVLDTSGSMMGFPIEKAKEAMRLALEGLNPQDTFNLITFSDETHILFPEPVAATPANMRRAQEFLASRYGGGGTEMMKAIRAALDPSDSQDHVRIVCFMTDGYVGNDMEIIAEIQRHPNARVFSFGIGSSVNRFLLEAMARHGRGEVEYVGLNEDGSAAARRFHERVRNPLLTDISIDWGGLPVTDPFPKRIPDLFSAKPVIIHGRYSHAARGTIRLMGQVAGRPFSRSIQVDLPGSEPRHDVLASLWARTRIDDLMAQDYNGLQNGNVSADLRNQITQLGLEYRLMTQFTSFVAVEEMIVTDGGQPRRIDVPVEMPEGVSYEGVFGEEAGRMVATKSVRGGGGSGVPMVASARRLAAPAAPMQMNAPAVTAMPAPPATSMPAQGVARVADLERRRDQEALLPPSKMHPAITAIVDQLRRGAGVAAVQARFVRDGKAEVRVWLNDDSPAAIAQLKAAGLEIIVQPKTAKLVIGRIAVDKLAALAELKVVRYLAPLE
ncbi:MAG: VIT and VWA domain-containing protein [Bryobacteraceae bacterium]